MNINEIQFKRIFESGRYFRLSQLSDARISTADGCTFDVHKVILASHSDFFRAMFCGIDKCQRMYTISNINGKCLSEILNYIYTNNIKVTEMNIKDLLVAADYFLMKDLYLKLKLQVKNNITCANCLKLYLAAHKLDEKEMFQLCLKFIHERFEEIIQNQIDDLVDLPLEILKNILSSRNLNVKSERTVWKIIIYWTQSCMESRLRCVQSLLFALAIDEIGDNLAEEIINHDFVYNNPHIKTLIDIESFNAFNSRRDLLVHVLQKLSNDFQLRKLRIPEKLNVISKYSEEHGEQSICEIFISYDETLSLWQKILHIDFEPEYLITLHSNLFIFGRMEPRCVKLNLRTMEMEYVRNFRYFGRTILATENCICCLYQNMDAYHIAVYNSDNNKWSLNPAFKNICQASAVAIRENILVIGVKSELDGMIALMINPITQARISLSPPKIYRSHFELVPYHGKIYVLGGVNAVNEVVWDVEVYDPELDFWKEIPRLPFDYAWVAAIVLEDQMIVYDLASMSTEGHTSSVVRWNDKDEWWESHLANPFLPEKLYNYRFCAVSDIETIKILTKRNRNFNTRLEKSSFNFV